MDKPVPSTVSSDRRAAKVGSLQSQLREILGPPPVIRGESIKSFNRLHRRVRAAVGPRNAIEELCARDLTVLAWEALRLRRLKARLMNALSDHCLQEILEDGELGMHFNNYDVDAVMKRWRRRDRDTVRLIKKQLMKVGLSLDDVAARAFVGNLRDIKCVDDMLSQLEARSSAIIRELDRHRDAEFHWRLREGLASDAEFEDVSADAEEVPA